MTWQFWYVMGAVFTWYLLWPMILHYEAATAAERRARLRAVAPDMVQAGTPRQVRRDLYRGLPLSLTIIGLFWWAFLGFWLIGKVRTHLGTGGGER